MAASLAILARDSRVAIPNRVFPHAALARPPPGESERTLYVSTERKKMTASGARNTGRPNVLLIQRT